MRLNETIIQRSKILKTIIQKTEKDFPNDISVLVCYGSFITGNMHKYSDIDFFFIPKTEKGYKLTYQFIVNGIGYDLWPISWNRAEKISKLEEPLQSIFIGGKVLYSSTDKDFQKYEDLVTTLKTNLQNKKDFPLNPNSYGVEKGDKEKQLSPTSLIGFYEELKSIYNKLKFACETNNLNLVVYCAQIIDRETSTKLKPFGKKITFPSLTESLLSKNFEKILSNSSMHEKILLKLLGDINIPLNIFSNEEEFEEAFNRRI